MKRSSKALGLLIILIIMSSSNTLMQPGHAMNIVYGNMEYDAGDTKFEKLILENMFEKQLK